MNLVTQIKQLEEEYELRLDKVRKREAKVEVSEAKLNELQEELDTIAKDLEKKQKEIARVTNNLDLLSKISQEQESLLELRIERSVEDRRLQEWENDLADIEESQDKREQRLQERVTKLDKDRKEYKEVVRKEFFEELSKRLPQ